MVNDQENPLESQPIIAPLCPGHGRRHANPDMLDPGPNPQNPWADGLVDRGFSGRPAPLIGRCNRFLVSIFGFPPCVSSPCSSIASSPHSPKFSLCSTKLHQKRAASAAQSTFAPAVWSWSPRVSPLSLQDAPVFCQFQTDSPIFWKEKRVRPKGGGCARSEVSVSTTRFASLGDGTSMDHSPLSGPRSFRDSASTFSPLDGKGWPRSPRAFWAAYPRRRCSRRGGNWWKDAYYTVLLQ
jgi:hypothetical protein